MTSLVGKAWSVRKSDWLEATGPQGKAWGQGEPRLGTKVWQGQDDLECCANELGCKSLASKEHLKILCW